jgi:hypothetical protein
MSSMFTSHGSHGRNSVIFRLASQLSCEKPDAQHKIGPISVMNVTLAIQAAVWLIRLHFLCDVSVSWRNSLLRPVD